MRIAALLLLVLAAPLAGGIGFAQVDGGPSATCGEGCIELEPGERVIGITPKPHRAVAWTAESELGVPIGAGVVREPAVVELPAGAARVRLLVV